MTPYVEIGITVKFSVSQFIVLNYLIYKRIHVQITIKSTEFIRICTAVQWAVIDVSCNRSAGNVRLDCTADALLYRITKEKKVRNI